jgi:large subunit ribosomal protein L1
MPNPKTDTVGTDVAKMVSELKKGKAAFKNDTGANVHISVGKVSFAPEKIRENIVAFLDALRKTKPSSSKGSFIKGVFLTTTMGPSIKVKAE